MHKKIGNILSALGIGVLLYFLEYKSFIPKNTFKGVLFLVATVAVIWNILFYRGIFRSRQMKWTGLVFSFLLLVAGKDIWTNYTKSLPLLENSNTIFITIFALFIGTQIGISLEKEDKEFKKLKRIIKK